ncbi:MAG: YigZ family protein [Bacteroidota bacterium]
MSQAEDLFYRIEENGEGLFKDRGSKFYAFAYPVQNVEEIEDRIRQLKKTYHDARHHCYAYRLGNRGETVYVNDDGEPSHSAGTPILAAIRSAELTDILIVVVRYFGGTKLGVRGLIEAYRTSAVEALEGLPKTPIIPKVLFSLTFPYNRTSEINRLLHPHPVIVVEAHYTDICRITYSIEKKMYPPLSQAFTSAGISWKVLQMDE